MSSYSGKLLSRISLVGNKHRRGKTEPIAIRKPKGSPPVTITDDASSDFDDFMIVSSEECSPDPQEEIHLFNSPSLSNPQPHEPKDIPACPMSSAQVQIKEGSQGASAIPSSMNEPQQTSPSLMADREDIDSSSLTIRALGHRTRKVIAMHLNPPKPFGNDWKGFADYLGFSHLELENFALREDPTGEVLKEWETQEDSTIGELKKALDYLGREDALSELEKPIKIDIEKWKKKKAMNEAQPLQVAEVSNSYPNIPRSQELRGITLHDNPDGPEETFDAYICHNEASDYSFVLEMIEKLEKSQYNLRLCTDFRNLVPGGDYNTVTAELIENRCKRMIVVLSPEFLENEKCDFHVKFALSLAPGARSRRMVLVMLKPCEPPPILRFITVCDYTREALRPFFWPRLYAALHLS